MVYVVYMAGHILFGISFVTHSRLHISITVFTCFFELWTAEVNGGDLALPSLLYGDN